ncbi:MAG TPA: hypothetical protein VF498_05120 [Anaerolineales bacterium]
MIAPALLLPLGSVLLGSNVLPRLLATLGLAMGAILQVFGLLGLFNVLQPVIDMLLIVQSGWFLAAAIALLVRQTGSIRLYATRFSSRSASAVGALQPGPKWNRIGPNNVN